MSDLLVEVDEALKQERLENLWHKYGGFIIGFLVAIILGTAANEGYKSWNKNQELKQTNIYLDAIEKNDATPESIIKASTRLNNNGLKGLAKMHAAGLTIENNNIEAALAIYRNIESSKDSDQTAQNIAKYMVTNLDNSLSADQKHSRYEALINDKNNPWRFHARFELALLEAHDAKNYKEARKHLEVILKEDLVAQTLKQKAKSLEIIYAAKESALK